MNIETNRRVIEVFYSRFAAGDGDAMAAAYAPDAHFSDPVFGDLRGSQIGDMWRMLLSRPDELTVRLHEVMPTDSGGGARWSADYRFGKARRKVSNRITAEFEIVDGLIWDHRDHFFFPAWARQALGPVGLVLGRTGYLQQSVRQKALARLARYSGRA